MKRIGNNIILLGDTDHIENNTDVYENRQGDRQRLFPDIGEEFLSWVGY